jgi:hypothetical protein
MFITLLLLLKLPPIYPVPAVARYFDRRPPAKAPHAHALPRARLAPASNAGGTELQVLASGHARHLR